MFKGAIRSTGQSWVSGGWLFLLLLVGLLPGARAAEQDLRRDDGKMAGKRNLSGGAHVITLDRPEGSWKVRAVKVHGLRSGRDYDPAKTFVTVTVADGKLAPLGVAKCAYGKFKTGKPSWVEVPFEKPVDVPSRFKVIVRTDKTAPKGIYVGYSTVKPSASGCILRGAAEKPFKAGKDWMIRAVLAGKGSAATPPEKRERVELKRDSGVKSIDMSLIGSSPAVEFDKPEGEHSIVAARVFLACIEESSLKYTVSAVTLEGKVLCSANASCKGLPVGDGSWVDVPFKKGAKCPDRFRIRVDFHWNLKKPGSDLVTLGAAATDRTHSTMLTDHSPPTSLPGLEFMIRAVLEPGGKKPGSGKSE
ncbi:MAG: hypothetical protein ABFS86_09180 [Planctomycetota bacterium]